MRHIVVRDLKLLIRQPTCKLLAHNSNRWFTTPDHRPQRLFHNSPVRQSVKPYLLADIGEGITECQIINWFVKPGDRVEQFDRICEVQSDKASVEITSRWDGTIKALHYGTDDMAVVGQPLLDIDIDETEENGNLSSPLPVQNEEKAEEVIMKEMQERSGPEPQTTPGIEVKSNESPLPRQSFTPTSESKSDLVTPGVRHLLKSLNLQVSDIQGTGRDGRVLKEDIQRHQAAAIESPTASTDKSTIMSVQSAEDRLVSLTPTENVMFKAMTRSLTIPHFLYTHSVDITNLNTMRKKLNSNTAGSSVLSSKLTPLPFIMKALSHAFTQMPKLNSHLDVESSPSKPQLLIKASHNFGIAIDTPQGLLVPVVRNVQNHSIVSLAAEIIRLSDLAKDGKLGVDDFKGATFSISNIGSIGGGVVSPIIVAPMVGILGVGRMKAVPAFVRNDDNGVEEMMVRKEEVVLSWSADHRVLDGATVAKCAEIVGRLLEDVDSLAVVLR